MCMIGEYGSRKGHTWAGSVTSFFANSCNFLFSLFLYFLSHAFEVHIKAGRRVATTPLNG